MVLSCIEMSGLKRPTKALEACIHVSSLLQAIGIQLNTGEARGESSDIRGLMGGGGTKMLELVLDRNSNGSLNHIA
jgi:hypothetical protein